MMVLKFATGVRVVVLTANFVFTDVEGKSQGVWYQEFPLRQSATCDFEVPQVWPLRSVFFVPFSCRGIIGKRICGMALGSVS